MATKDRAEEYFAARNNYDQAQAEAKKAYGEMRAAETRLIDSMMVNNLKSFTTDEQLTVSLRQHFSISVTQDNSHSIREWLMGYEGDDAPYVMEVPDKKAITEMLKRKITEERTLNEDDVPDFFNLKTSPGISVLGWRSRDK